MKKIILIISFLLLTACGNNFEGDFSYKVQSFEFKNQEGELFNSEQLDKTIWVANMMFTNCKTVCPSMTANMARLQDKLKQEGLAVELVSFSVDPENDTPAKLKKYAKDRGGSFDNWNLLTGYEFQDIKEISIKSFHAMLETDPETNDKYHTTYFYLVSSDGNAVKRYDGTQAANMDEIVVDIKKMM